jgi:hypothetical protein
MNEIKVTSELSAMSRKESELVVKFRTSSLIRWSGLSTLCEPRRR